MDIKSPIIIRFKAAPGVKVVAVSTEYHCTSCEFNIIGGNNVCNSQFSREDNFKDCLNNDHHYVTHEEYLRSLENAGK